VSSDKIARAEICLNSKQTIVSKARSEVRDGAPKESRACQIRGCIAEKERCTWGFKRKRETGNTPVAICTRRPDAEREPICGGQARARGQPLLWDYTRALTARGRLRHKTQIPHRQLRLFPPVCTLRSSLFRLSALKWHLQREEEYYQMRDFWRRSCSRGAHVIALASGFVLYGVVRLEILLSLNF
jgi:hypothetical protein